MDFLFIFAKVIKIKIRSKWEYDFFREWRYTSLIINRFSTMR